MLERTEPAERRPILRVLSAHQPVYLPGLILLNKIALSDVFVLLPDVQFERSSWQQRNRIRTGAEAVMLTVPVRKSGDLGRTIRQTQIADEPWRRKHLAGIAQAYGKRPWFDAHFPQLAAIVEAEHASIAALNATLLAWLCAAFAITTPLLDSADLPHEGTGQDRLIALARAVGADAYVSNIGAAAYVDEAGFAAAGIAHRWQAFRHPVYAQGRAFLPNLSAIDALFNLGPEAGALVRASGWLAGTLEEARQAFEA